MAKVMITCAVTGSADTQHIHPDLPITPDQIADSAIAAARAGATIVHIHVRDPETGGQSHEPAYYAHVVERIRSSGVDVVINLTTGMAADYVPSDDDPAIGGPGTWFEPPAARMRHIVELRPEICSLDVATMNFGDVIFANTPKHLAIMAGIAAEHGVKPELEVFDLGHIALARRMIEQGLIAAPPLFQLCLGVKWGAPATPETMMHMCASLPDDAVWSAFGTSAQQLPMAAQAAVLGGNVRVGLEDNLYLARGVFARNEELVARARTLIEAMGKQVMSPAEARDRLALRRG
jgi:uncharacterized protein (DUF849 family)